MTPKSRLYHQAWFDIHAATLPVGRAGGTEPNLDDEDYDAWLDDKKAEHEDWYRNNEEGGR